MIFPHPLLCGSFLTGSIKIIYVKNFKFINGCKANNDTHTTARIFLTSNIYGAYIIAIDQRNSPMALQANSCLNYQLLCKHKEYSVA